MEIGFCDLSLKVIELEQRRLDIEREYVLNHRKLLLALTNKEYFERKYKESGREPHLFEDDAKKLQIKRNKDRRAALRKVKIEMRKVKGLMKKPVEVPMQSFFDY